MATRLQLYNRALRHLKEQPLVTVTDDVPARYILDDAFEDVALDCLTRGVWNFALKQVLINEDPSLTPAFGYQFAFAKPTDWLFTNVVSTDPDFNEYLNIDFQGYRDVGNVMSANADMIYVEYASRDFALEANLGSWGESFSQFMPAQLAFETVGPITQSTTLKETMNQIAKKRLGIAKSRDAKDERETQVRTGSWARAQGGYGARTNRQRLQAGTGLQTREGKV